MHGFLPFVRGGRAPLFVIDAHPVDVCRPVRAGDRERMEGFARMGYCASLDRWFCGLKEHLIFTPGGCIAFVRQMPGNRHDVQGLYSLLRSSFRGFLLGDSGYWPKEEKRRSLEAGGIFVMADTHSDWKVQYGAGEKAWLKRNRSSVERWISLFNTQFNAHHTLCRSLKHHVARRWLKALSHNCSRFVNRKHCFPLESTAHFRLAA